MKTIIVLFLFFYNFILIDYMNISNKEKIILTNLLLDYSHENWFPFYEKVKDFNETNKLIFWSISKEEYYKNLLEYYIIEKVDNSKGTKMWKSFKQQFDQNKDLYLNFAKLNIEKTFDEKFNTIGEKIKLSLQGVENELFKSLETSKYKDFSSGIYKKYEKFIKSFFPYINNVWVSVSYIKR